MQLPVNSGMPSHETVILNHDLPILVIKWRKVKRITHDLPPVLPTSKDVMIVVFVVAANVLANVSRVVVIHRSALILRVQILQHYMAQPRRLLQVQLCP